MINLERSFRAKTQVLMMVPLILLSAGHLLMSVRIMENNLRDQYVDRAISIARFYQSVLKDYLNLDQVVRFVSDREQLRKIHPDILEGRLYVLRGSELRPFDGTGGTGIPDTTVPARIVNALIRNRWAFVEDSYDGRPVIMVFEPMEINGTTRGAVRLILTTERRDKEIRSYILRQLVFFSGILIASVGIGLWTMNRWVIYRIDKLRERVADLGAGIPMGKAVDLGRDEIGDLARTFSSMAGQLSESRDALLREIDERKQIERSLRMKTQELERSNRDLEDFAFVSSHDLQEPLRKVINYTQLLNQRCKGRLDANAEKFMSVIINGSNRMMALIQALLSYSRINREELKPTATDMNTALREALYDLDIMIKGSGAKITAETLPFIIGSQEHMRRLFQNLVGNAVKFRSSRPPHIRVSAEEMGEEWMFSVQDNGIGIAPQFTERIFVIFQRLHSQAQYPGTGIGLAICRKIVERYGGRIWVESKPGSGSTFYFTLPIRH